ncbi:phosphoribosyltransferase [Azotobacter chroococcum]|uniref:Putative phosphoribosyltransferase n=1 Tax=Azotobacter chroococcum TaxID=353 RepID=A0A4R1PUC6_9GAMM|nr:phosphoribosyltransferase [Azotobacter chroococcum]TBV99341.1 phosphoribosyltransferase [Azotobacter chroococcum]TCL29722.1 putative phosphoribosyltransferase [Azotobacter chroococcum]
MSLNIPFPDRVQAGRNLAEHLSSQGPWTNALVLALPRGGVPVAYEVASRLGLELDILVVRKLGLPGHQELAMGAIASGGVQVMNEDIVHYAHVPPATIEHVADRELQELQRREHAYRGERAQPSLRERPVILIDDGLATGATMRAAIEAVRRLGATSVIVAVPVGAPETVGQLRRLADRVICLYTPQELSAIGYWYRDFSQVSDREVQELLQRAWSEKKKNGERQA